jgi:hypothetical protein
MVLLLLISVAEPLHEADADDWISQEAGCALSDERSPGMPDSTLSLVFTFTSCSSCALCLQGTLVLLSPSCILWHAGDGVYTPLKSP